MPIYEYVCLDCKNEFETIRSMKDADKPAECEKCGGMHVKRKLAVIYAMSGGHAVSGTSHSCNCGSCSGGNCSSCNRPG